MSARSWGPVLSLFLAAVLAGCANGAGTLEPLIDPEGEISGFGEFSNGFDKSFGFFVCARDGSVTLESIEAISTEGEIELLGAVVYTEVEGGRFVGAVHGYPPAGIEEGKLQPLEEAVVEVDCDDAENVDQVQIVVGAERTGSAGGQIDGLRVNTDSGPAEVDYGIILCGNDFEFCEGLRPDEDG